MWGNVEPQWRDKRTFAMHVKSYLNKLWQTLFGEMRWHRWWWWWRRRLMTTPAYVRQQIARLLFINGKIWEIPQTNGLHVVAFNAFTSYRMRPTVVMIPLSLSFRLFHGRASGAFCTKSQISNVSLQSPSFLIFAMTCIFPCLNPAAKCDVARFKAKAHEIAFDQINLYRKAYIFRLFSFSWFSCVADFGCRLEYADANFIRITLMAHHWRNRRKRPQNRTDWCVLNRHSRWMDAPCNVFYADAKIHIHTRTIFAKNTHTHWHRQSDKCFATEYS